MGQTSFSNEHDKEWIVKFPDAEERSASAEGEGVHPRRPCPVHRRSPASARPIPAGITVFTPDSTDDGLAGHAAGKIARSAPVAPTSRNRSPHVARIATNIERLFEELEQGIDLLDRDVSAVIDAAGSA